METNSTNEESKNHDYFLKDWEEYLKNNYAKKTYSINKLDTLLVSISTLGIGFITSYLENIKDEVCPIHFDPTLAYLSEIIFLIAILLNLFSQAVAYKMSRIEILFGENWLYYYRYSTPPESKAEEKFKEEQKQLHESIKLMSSVIMYMNFITLFIVPISIAIFILFTYCYS